MPLRTRVALSAISALMLSSSSQGQEGARALSQSVRASGGGAVLTITNGVVAGVSGAPYSGHRIMTRVQTLADGTQITQETKRFEARDSQGRTRFETYLAEGEFAASQNSDQPILVTIVDPVDRRVINLDGRRKIATVTSFSSPRKPISPGGPVPPVLSAHTEGHLSIEKLGGQTIDGVYAEGTLRTEVHPAGTIGNNRDITVTTETWRSPDLRLDVLEKHTDPRSGDTTREMRDLDRNEPDPALFQIPEGYQIKTPEQN